MTVHVTTAVRNARIDALTGLLDAGTIKFYDGSQPANANTAISSQTLLATLTLNATAFAAASGGSATANAITSAAIATSGTCTWARIATSGGTTVCDCSVGIAGSGPGGADPDIVVPTATFTSGVTLGCSSLVLSEAA